MAAPKNASNIEPERYNEVVAHATISDIQLIAAKFDLKPDAVEIARDTWTFQVSDELDDWACDNEKGVLSGTYIYSASCVLGRRRLLNVTCRYLSTFKLSGMCDQDASHHYLMRVGRFSAYPYFRSVFASLTQQSGITLPPLPIISDGPRWVTPRKEPTKARRPKGAVPA